MGVVSGQRLQRDRQAGGTGQLLVAVTDPDLPESVTGQPR
jgi:hypothetical protein